MLFRVLWKIYKRNLNEKEQTCKRSLRSRSMSAHQLRKGRRMQNKWIIS